MAQNTDKISIKFDIETLDMIIAFLFTDSRLINRGSLINIKNLFDIIDDRAYKSDSALMSRVEYIRKALHGRLEINIENVTVLFNYCRDNKIEDISIIEDAIKTLKLNSSEIKYINTMVADRLRYAFIYKYKDNLLDIIERVEMGDFNSLKDINNEFKTTIGSFANDIRKVESRELTELTFDLTSDNFYEVVKYVVDKLSVPSNKLNLGIQALNDMMNGGPENGRVYLFLGLAGGFKSGVLLSIANWIKRYNKNYQTKDPNKRPAVLFITQENTLEETVERLFNMTVCADDIRGFKPEDVIHKLRTEGGFTLTDESNVDIIIQYYPNKSINTGSLYSIIGDLEDNGVEVIALIHDYVKRIRPVEQTSEIRFALGAVIDEFKVLAQQKDIPVITASQLNKDAAKTVDSAVEGNKSDIIRLLGRSNVGESWSQSIKYIGSLIRRRMQKNLFNCWNLLLTVGQSAAKPALNYAGKVQRLSKAINL